MAEEDRSDELLEGTPGYDEFQKWAIKNAKKTGNVVKSILPDPTNPAEVGQEFVELAGDMWATKNPYRGAALYTTKKFIQNSPEAARTLKIVKETASPYIQRGKEWLQKDHLEPVYAGIEKVTGIKRRVGVDLADQSAQPLKSLSGVSTGTTQPGYTGLEGLKSIVYSDVPIQKDVQGFVKTGQRELLDSKQIRVQRYLEEGPSKHLHSKYKDRRGYLNAEKLSKNSRLLKQILNKHDEVTELFKTYMAKKRAGASSKTLSKYQREVYEKIGENYFSDSALIYGQDRFRDKLVRATQWFSKDHWHHIFGNKEWGEFMLTEVAQDPLIAVNLYKHLKKAKLSTAGVSENLLIMKQAGHNNLHEFFKHIGIQQRYANRAPANFEDIGQEISRTVRGEAKAAKTFTTETGEVITKGTPYPAEPEAVNELFTMIDAYAKHNKWVREKFKQGKITVMEPIGDKSQRVVVRNGYKPKKGEIVEVFDLTANKGGKPKAPEVYAHKVGRIRKITEEFLIEK